MSLELRRMLMLPRVLPWKLMLQHRLEVPLRRLGATSALVLQLGQRMSLAAVQWLGLHMSLLAVVLQLAPHMSLAAVQWLGLRRSSAPAQWQLEHRMPLVPSSLAAVQHR